jgi:hypothetical protein
MMSRAVGEDRWESLRLLRRVAAMKFYYVLLNNYKIKREDKNYFVQYSLNGLN